MITLQLLTNREEIIYYLYIDKLYKDLLELENGVELNKWSPDLNHKWFVIKNEDKWPIGIFMLKSFSSNCAAFHGGIFRNNRSQNSVQILKDCLQICRQNHKFKYITYISSNNIACLKLIKKAGFKHMGTYPNACLSGDLEFYIEGNN